MDDLPGDDGRSHWFQVRKPGNLPLFQEAQVGGFADSEPSLARRCQSPAGEETNSRAQWDCFGRPDRPASTGPALVCGSYGRPWIGRAKGASLPPATMTPPASKDAHG